MVNACMVIPTCLARSRLSGSGRHDRGRNFDSRLADASKAPEVPSPKSSVRKRGLTKSLIPVSIGKALVSAIHVSTTRRELHDEAVALVVSHNFELAATPSLVP